MAKVKLKKAPKPSDDDRCAKCTKPAAVGCTGAVDGQVYSIGYCEDHWSLQKRDGHNMKPKPGQAGVRWI